jgi:predicted DNA binding CopG/RHH family protein
MSTQKARNMNVKDKPLNMRVTAAERAAIVELAKNEGLPVATFIVWLLRKEAKERGLEWPQS